MEKILIHFGSDEAFEQVIQDAKPYNYLPDIFENLNKTKVTVEGMSKQEEEPPLDVENLIIKTDDYGAIKEWALLGFSNNVLEDLRINIKNVWMNNPPKKIYDDVKKNYSKIITEKQEEHLALEVDRIKKIAENFSGEIIGQNRACRKILPTLYSLTNPKRKKPITLLFLGKSGVGKTEAAKYIASEIDGDMLRIQFSMQQTNEAYKYIFGSEHGEDSLARELIRRKSNVILLDEFDKVHNSMYNAFYQMFDEGKFVDSNYEVDLERCIIICTSNFQNEEDAEKYLGTPIYSRFSKVITFDEISIDNKIIIAQKSYDSLFNNLMEEDRILIQDNKILPFFEEHIKTGAYTNMRMLRNDIEDALNVEILKARRILD